MDFWNVLRQKLASIPPKGKREAELVLERRINHLYGNIFKQASTDEEKHNAFLLVRDSFEDEVKKISREYNVNFSHLYDFGKKQLIGGKREFFKVADSFNVNTDAGKFRVTLEKSQEMGAKEYEGEESVYIVTVKGEDGFTNVIPFLSEDGSVPEEARMLFDSMKDRQLSNWPADLKQKVESYQKRMRKEAETVKVEPTPEMENIVRQIDEIKKVYSEIQGQLDDIKKQLSQLKGSPELEEIYKLANEGKKVFAEIDGILHEFTVTKRFTPGYKKALEYLIEKVNPDLKRKAEEIKQTAGTLTEIRDVKIKGASLGKTSGGLSRLKNLLKGFFSSAERHIRKIKKLMGMKEAGINPHCPHCGSIQLKKSSGNGYSCQICGKSFKYHPDGTYEHTPNLETKDTTMSAGFGPARKAKRERMRKKALNAADVVGYTTSDGEFLCERCAEKRAEKMEEEGIEVYNEYGELDEEFFYPVFADSEWDSFPVCDDCGEKVTDVSLTQEGYEYEKEYHPWLKDLYEASSRIRKNAQNVFTPTDFAAEPESMTPEIEEPKEEKTVTKSYCTEEEIRRWFGGHIPKKDSVVIDAKGNRWKYNGSAGPDTHEIELITDEGPTPDKEIGEPAGLIPPEEEPSEEAQLMMEESSSEEMRKMSQIIICKNCENYNEHSRICEFWDIEVSPKDKCEYFEPVGTDSDIPERYIPAPKMEEDLAAEGAEKKVEKTGRRNYYKDDPRWIEAKYRGYCYDCQREISPRERILYWPKGRHVYCEECGQKHWQRFLDEAADEDFFSTSSKFSQMEMNVDRVIKIFNDDPEVLREEVYSMNQDELAKLIDEINILKGNDRLKKFLSGLWNEKYSHHDIEGQKNFYEMDAPVSYNAVKPKQDQSLSRKRIPLEKLASEDESDEKIVEKILSFFDDILDIREIYRGDDYVEILYA